MCDNQFYSSFKKKQNMHTQTEVSYLGRDLRSKAAIAFHVSPIYVELHLCACQEVALSLPCLL